MPDFPLDKRFLLGIIMDTTNPSSALTEESSMVKVDRNAGAQTETPAQWKPYEVPSRAAQVNANNH